MMLDGAEIGFWEHVVVAVMRQPPTKHGNGASHRVAIGDAIHWADQAVLARRKRLIEGYCEEIETANWSERRDRQKPNSGPYRGP